MSLLTRETSAGRILTIGNGAADHPALENRRMNPTIFCLIDNGRSFANRLKIIFIIFSHPLANIGEYHHCQ